MLIYNFFVTYGGYFEIERLTKMKIEIDSNMNLAHIYAPYHNEFRKQISYINGAQWDSTLKCWIVPAGAIMGIREIMRNIFGYDDITEAIDVVDLRLTANRTIRHSHDDINFCGKCLCHATSRNSGGSCGADVVYIQGFPSSGGSMKNWESVIPAGAVILVNNVCRNFFEEYKNSIEYVNEYRDFEIELICESKLPLPEQLKKNMTNIERIRSMEAKELAEFFVNNCDNLFSEDTNCMCDFCNVFKEKNDEKCNKESCIETIIEWLQTEV